MLLREALTQVDLFSALPDSALDKLVQGGTTLKMHPGHVLVTQGSTDAGFQLVRDGSVVVSVNGVEVATQKAGGYFGEMSLIDSAARSATVVAGPEGAETFAVSALTFSSLMNDNPQIARALLPVLTARIRSLEAPLHQAPE